jgi:hypothetical protein
LSEQQIEYIINNNFSWPCDLKSGDIIHIIFHNIP